MTPRPVTLVKLGVVGLIALVGGGFALFTYLKTQANVVFFDNTHHEVVEVFVNGDSQGTVEPGQALAVELDPGNHEVVATGASGELVRGGFQVADGSAFRGLYDLGGTGRYVVVRAIYNSAGGDTQYELLPEGQRFLTLPTDVSPDGLDQAFPSSITTQSGVATLTHLCHYDPATEAIGCPNA